MFLYSVNHAATPRHIRRRNKVAATRSYKIIFASQGSFAVNALALACEGSWRDAVQRYNGKHDLAFIDVEEEYVPHLEELLEQDDNVLSYLCTDH